jgi:hypothetical protein
VTPDPDAVPAKERRLGVVGTLVWDTIRQRDGRAEPVEEWGGIGYALEALSLSLPDGWTIVPLLKIGRDLSEEAFRFLRSVPRVLPEPGVNVVPEPNNRVELRYAGQVRETERLSGGVPPWVWTELGPRAAGCDALYVNFVSGFEMELETAVTLRERFRGPIYADLHSLFLGIGRRGDRIPRPLPHWAEWLRCFDAVQMNESEFELLGRAEGDPWSLAARIVGPQLKLVAVTLGSRGAAYVAGAGFRPDPFSWPGTRTDLAAPGPARSAKVQAEVALEEGDPTGCGDVWGATFFARLLGGDSLEDAMRLANRMAGRNLRYRGARGLGAYLAGKVDVGGALR